MKIDFSIGILNNKEFLSVRETAFFLNISEKSVRRMIDSAEISCYKIRGCFRLRKKDIEKYLAKSTLKPI
jgi:excisionase family DNA binding protein